MQRGGVVSVVVTVYDAENSLEKREEEEKRTEKKSTKRKDKRKERIREEKSLFSRKHSPYRITALDSTEKTYSADNGLFIYK